MILFENYHLYKAQSRTYLIFYPFNDRLELYLSLPFNIEIDEQLAKKICKSRLKLWWQWLSPVIGELNLWPDLLDYSVNDEID